MQCKEITTAVAVIKDTYKFLKKNCSNEMKLTLRVFKDCLCHQLLCIITSHKVFTVSLPGVIDDNICTNYGCYWLSTGIYWAVEVHRRRGEAEPSLDFNSPTFSSQLKPYMYLFFRLICILHTHKYISLYLLPRLDFARLWVMYKSLFTDVYSASLHLYIYIKFIVSLMFELEHA